MASVRDLTSHTEWSLALSFSQRFSLSPAHWSTSVTLCHYSCFPGGSDGKESACNAEAMSWITPGSGRYPGEGNGNPLHYSCLENPMDRGPGRLQFLELQRTGHDRGTECMHIHTHTHKHTHTFKLLYSCHYSNCCSYINMLLLIVYKIQCNIQCIVRL